MYLNYLMKNEHNLTVYLLNLKLCINKESLSKKKILKVVILMKLNLYIH